jgi:OOP family OmpA-OmpF porin
MKLTRHILLATAMACPLCASAAELAMPAGSVLAAQKHDGVTSQKLAIGPFDGKQVPSIWAEGNRSVEAWQGASDGRTTLQLIDPLKKQLEADGYDVLYECRDRDCGGFDFRYAQDLLPEPDMHVDLGNYRFLSAQRMAKDGTPEYVSLMVSENRTRDFIQITRLGPEAAAKLVPAATSTMNDPAAPVDQTSPVTTLGDELSNRGVAVLDDLSFEAGSAKLDSSESDSLTALAGLLKEHPAMRVSLVGHTDTNGSMAANLSLSKARAAQVRQALIDIYGVTPDQVDAQGVGYLAPMASNASASGREQNRRVEVVLVSNG